MMKLSQRMNTAFCANISASGSQSWTALSDSTEDTVRITTRKNTEPGQPSGVILTAVSTSWLPFSHQQVFELLADEQQRCQVATIYIIFSDVVIIVSFGSLLLEFSLVYQFRDVCLAFAA